MELNKDLFAIDAPAATERLCAFIRERQSALGRLGLLVPLSGGLDSSTVLLLCARASGAENVTAVLLPERQGNPAARHYARLITERFGIKTLTRNISPILGRLGSYQLILAMVPTRRLRNWFAAALHAGEHAKTVCAHLREAVRRATAPECRPLCRPAACAPRGDVPAG